MIDQRQPSTDLTIKRLTFDALDLNTLYDLLHLRQAVFCVEQNCAYQDLDGKDQAAWHVLAYLQGELAGAVRILMPNTSYPDAASIGRVASAQKFRGQNVGRSLMQFAVSECLMMFPNLPIRIGAQRYLEAFYQSFGFQTCSEPYLEDGIEHVEMERPAGLSL